MLPADYVFGLAVALIVTLNFYFGRRIEQDRIAMQWGRNGEPTWSAPNGSRCGERLSLWDLFGSLFDWFRPMRRRACTVLN
jgi:hypothetical protein